MSFACPIKILHARKLIFISFTKTQPQHAKYFSNSAQSHSSYEGQKADTILNGGCVNKTGVQERDKYRWMSEADWHGGL